MKAKSAGTKSTPEAELRSLIGRLDPKIQKLSRAVRTAARKRFPTANELAYDYKSFVVIAYSPSERGIDGIVSFAARPNGVFFYFSHGPQLPDPKGLLQGSAKMVRFIELESASRLAHPDVEALIAASIALASVPLPSAGEGRLITMSAGKKRRPRPKAKKK